MTETAKIKAKVLREFNDAGTGERFAAGDSPEIDAGAFANYRAAGLVEKDAPEAKPKAEAKKTADA